MLTPNDTDKVICDFVCRPFPETVAQWGMQIPLISQRSNGCSHIHVVCRFSCMLPCSRAPRSATLLRIHSFPTPSITGAAGGPPGISSGWDGYQSPPGGILRSLLDSRRRWSSRRLLHSLRRRSGRIPTTFTQGTKTFAAATAPVPVTSDDGERPSVILRWFQSHSSLDVGSIPLRRLMMEFSRAWRASASSSRTLFSVVGSASCMGSPTPPRRIHPGWPVA